jgi:hypothetical protein
MHSSILARKKKNKNSTKENIFRESAKEFQPDSD